MREMHRGGFDPSRAVGIPEGTRQVTNRAHRAAKRQVCDTGQDSPQAQLGADREPSR